MHRIISLLGVIITLMLTGCTHNNGDIGFWFGTWQATEITIDGEKREDYDGNIFFKFQANVCDVLTVFGHNDYSQRFAEFKDLKNGTIIIAYGYTENVTPEFFLPPKGTNFVKGENILEVNKYSNRKVLLTCNNGESTYTYLLKKQ